METRNDVNYAEIILDTIDSLRKRKARPDLERICHMIQRRYNINASETTARLEGLVEAKIVIKVDYKGSTSYRNAAKWKRAKHFDKSSSLQSKIKTMLPTAMSMTMGPEGVKVDELTIWYQNYAKQSGLCASRKLPNTTGGNSNDNLQKSNNTVQLEEFDRNLKQTLSLVLSKELALGKVKMLVNGNYVRSCGTPESRSARNSSSDEHSESGVPCPMDLSMASVKQKQKDSLTLKIGDSLRYSDFQTLSDEQKAERLKPFLVVKEGDSSNVPIQPKPAALAAIQPKLTSKARKIPSITKLQQNDQKIKTVPGKRGRPPLGSKKKKCKKPFNMEGQDKIKIRKSDSNHSPGSTNSNYSGNSSSRCSSHSSSQSSSHSSNYNGGSSGSDLTGTGTVTSESLSPVPTNGSDNKSTCSPVDKESRCDYCLNTSAVNRHGIPEELLFCKDCPARAHPSCMSYSKALAKRAQNSPWQCIDCKTCFICKDPNQPDAMLFCDSCDKGYHMLCHSPKIKIKPIGKWVCNDCSKDLDDDETINADEDIKERAEETVEEETLVQEREMKRKIVEEIEEDDLEEVEEVEEEEIDEEDLDEEEIENDERNTSPPFPHAAFWTWQHMEKVFIAAGEEELAQQAKDKTKEPIKYEIPQLRHILAREREIPDPKEWTTDDVAAYFHRLGFVNEAKVFKEQDIDGKSMLLLKRNDVIGEMDLLIGPALKIYHLIERMQCRGYEHCLKHPPGTRKPFVQ